MYLALSSIKIVNFLFLNKDNRNRNLLTHSEDWKKYSLRVDVQAIFFIEIELNSNITLIVLRISRTSFLIFVPFLPSLFSTCDDIIPTWLCDVTPTC